MILIPTGGLHRIIDKDDADRIQGNWLLGAEAVSKFFFVRDNCNITRNNW